MGTTAIVILNWNGLHFLQQFLPVILERTEEIHTGMATLVVADNGSADGSVAWLQQAYPQVRLILFDKNYGFTGGYNRAFAAMQAWEETFDYFLLLNSDVEVTHGWLTSLVAQMDRHPEIGVCSPKVRSHARPAYFEHAGACGGLMDWFGFPYCRGRVFSTLVRDCGQYDTAQPVFWASGTSFLIRTSLYARTGGLDDLFFAHMEEIDLCWRVQSLGYQVWVVPESVIYHVGGGTLPNNSPRKLYLNFRNNLYMLYKNLPERTRGLRIFLRLVVDWGIAAVYLLTGKWAFFRSVMRAHRDYFKNKNQLTRPEQLTSVVLPRTTLIGEWWRLRKDR